MVGKTQFQFPNFLEKIHSQERLAHFLRKLVKLRVQLDAKVFKGFSEPIMMIIFPSQRFFRYHDHMFNKALHEKKRRSAVHVMPYGLIFKQCFPQCFNVFFTYFVTLTIFPAVLAGKSDKSSQIIFHCKPGISLMTMF